MAALHTVSALPVGPVSGPILAAGRLVALWELRHRSRRALARLDAGRLADLGLSPAEAAAEAARPFWKA